MSLDVRGRLYAELEKLIQSNKHYEAFQKTMEILSLYRPLSTEWIKVLSISERLIDMLQETNKKAMAMIILLDHICGVDTYKCQAYREKLEDLSKYIYDKALLEKIMVRVSGISPHDVALAKNDIRRTILNEVARMERELSLDPMRAKDIERLFINNLAYLTEEDRNKIKGLLMQHPPVIEFESEVKSPDPLLLPSKLICEIKLKNKGVRSGRVSRLLVKISPKMSAEDASLIEIDPSPGTTLELGPGESKTMNIKINVNKIGELDLYLGLKYVDKIGVEYLTELKYVGMVTAIIPSISDIQTKRLDDEFSKSRTELVVVINDALNKVTNLYKDMVEKPKKEIIDSFNRQFAEYVSFTLRDNLSRRLKTVRDQYKSYLRECRNLNERYDEIVEIVAGNVYQLDKEIRSLSSIFVEGGGKITMNRVIREKLYEIIKNAVKIKWIEDKDFRDSVDKLKARIDSQIPDISDINLLNLVFLILVVHRDFDIKFIKDIKERLDSYKSRRENIQELREYFKEAIKLLEDLKVDASC